MFPSLPLGRGVISLTPMTTELVAGNFISFVVGFCIAMSVITSPGLEGMSTWYMHSFPGVDNGLTNQALLVLDSELGLSISLADLYCSHHMAICYPVWC
jgi:hypothetical protein